MASLVFVSSVFVLFIQVVLSSPDYDFISQEIAMEMNSLKEESEDLVSSIDKLVVHHKSMLPNLESLKPQHLNSREQMYKLYSQRNGKSARKCLAAQRNLEMVQNYSKDNIQQCNGRVGKILQMLRDKAVAIKAMVSKHVSSCLNLTSPCEMISNKKDCLAQAWEQVKQKKDSIMATLQRFNILKKLKEFEADLHCKVCCQVAESCQHAQQHEQEVVDNCIKQDAQIPNETMPEPKIDT